MYLFFSCKSFVLSLKALGIRPMFLFDSDLCESKMDIWFERREREIQKGLLIFDRLSRGYSLGRNIIGLGVMLRFSVYFFPPYWLPIHRNFDYIYAICAIHNWNTVHKIKVLKFCWNILLYIYFAFLKNFCSEWTLSRRRWEHEATTCLYELLCRHSQIRVRQWG